MIYSFEHGWKQALIKKRLPKHGKFRQMKFMYGFQLFCAVKFQAFQDSSLIV